MAIIDMRTMRYLNLLDKVAHVKTSKCFVHNGSIFFAVNKNDVSRAIGPAAINVRRMQEKTGKNIRIIEEAENLKDIRMFIEDIVSPVRIKSAEIKDNAVIITAGNNQTKASLIGRNKRRLEELNDIIQNFFSMNVKVV